MSGWYFWHFWGFWRLFSVAGSWVVKTHCFSFGGLAECPQSRGFADRGFGGSSVAATLAGLPRTFWSMESQT